ncbi:ABC transporter permease [Antarcticibacterium sp. 1MA-6-2]|uniref:ABC transporter permease n=1 Tax=Antarcticibacterium sp. 1MA-6-2 TaxID=2908210 RepID=UPI001F3E9EC5|nr:ABC transporter permease [Antarcticibacterium sp. 1MA-6-2]UJH91011.1 ABC transporter permease [Antarcticibacterium sp. 1MA-6-2]
MRTTDLGFDKEQIVMLRPNNNPAQEALQQALYKIPEVKTSTFSSSVPGGNNYGAYSEIENKKGDLQIANIDVYFVDFDYIPTFDIDLAAGRTFSRDFASDTTQAMLINESAVQLLGYSSAEEAIGRKFRQWGREGQIVGVVKDFHFTSLQEEIKPLSMRIEPDRTNLLAVKIDPGNVPGTIASIEKEWNKLLPQQPFDYYFLDEFFDRQYRSEQRFGALFLNFAGLAIFISCLGLLGLASYSTIQRRREIGIRKIVGASVSGIVNLLSIEF